MLEEMPLWITISIMMSREGSPSGRTSCPLFGNGPSVEFE